MNIDTWLTWVQKDADARALPELKPLLETLARSIAALRTADEVSRARAQPHPDRYPHPR
jgi:hypothetical protein